MTILTIQLTGTYDLSNKLIKITHKEVKKLLFFIITCLIDIVLIFISKITFTSKLLFKK